MIAAVGSLNASVTAAFERDAAALIGGDLQIEVATHADPAARARGGPAAGARVVRGRRAPARSISAAERPPPRRLPQGGRRRLPALRRGRAAPALPLAEALRDNGAVVERAVLARLGVASSATASGSATSTVRIAAVVEREPDRLGGFFAIGPRLLVGNATSQAAASSAAGRARPLRLRAGPAARRRRPRRVAAGSRREAPDAGWRVQAAATSSRRSPAHRPPRHLPDPRRAHSARHRRPRRGARGRRLPRLPARHHRDA